MAPPSSSSVCAHHVIVDSGGFISNAPIKDLAPNVYCIQEVVNEIKDKATKQRLQVLPYSLNFREPSAESVATVSAFAKKTGDYRSLSATDVKLIALTYQLEKEHVGTSHLRCEPPKKPESVIISSKRNESQDSTIAGFYLGDLNKHHDKPTQKKKVVDDLINSLEKLKVAVEEVKSDFTRSPSYEGEELTTNETVYSSFNYWREPLLDLDNLLDPGILATAETTVSSRSTNQQNAKKPTPPPKPAHLISPKKKSGSTSSASSASSSGINDVTSGLNDVTSPDFDDFLYWKADMCLSPEEIDCMLLKDSGVSDVGGGSTTVEVERCEGKREKEKENEERKRMTEEEVSSWGDLGRKVREEEDAAVTREKQDLSSMLEGKVVQGGTDDMSEDEDDEEEQQQTTTTTATTTTSSGGFGGGWITPRNIGSIKREGNGDEDRSEPVKVACLTTDFAMQNVLIQMGLNVIGVNGKVIKRARSYALRCYGCFKLTFNQEKRFCPHCGNETLKRVSIKVNDDGTLQYFISLRKPLSAKGKNQTLPPPKGGKHSTDPIVFEDQRVPHNRPSKMAANKSNVDALDADFVARDSPFATNDVTSRAALMGINAGNRRGSGGKGGRKRRR